MTPEEEDLHAWQSWWDQAETIYLSKEDYDHLQDRLNQPSDPKTIQSLKKLLERRAPWDDDSETN